LRQGGFRSEDPKREKIKATPAQMGGGGGGGGGVGGKSHTPPLFTLLRLGEAGVIIITLAGHARLYSIGKKRTPSTADPQTRRYCKARLVTAAGRCRKERGGRRG